MSELGSVQSPDFVLMRLVSAAEFDLPELLPGGGSGTGGRPPSPHYSSPLRGKGAVQSDPEPPPLEAPGLLLDQELELHHGPPLQEPPQPQLLLWPRGSSDPDPERSPSPWPPALLDQALRLLGGAGGGGGCSCHSGGAGGEELSHTSDALLVLGGLGSEQGGGEGGCEGDLGGAEKGAGGQRFCSGTLSGLMQQVHRLAEEAGALPPPSPRPPDPLPWLQQSCSQPQSRASTPRLGGGAGGGGRCPSPLVVLEGQVGGAGREGAKSQRGKSRKGGSLKLRLSKLFRTRSSGGGTGGLLDKRLSLCSSSSSGGGGSLLDMWGSTCSSTGGDGSRLQVSRPLSAFSPVSFTPAFTGETVSLVDVDISRRAGNSPHPPTPPPPPRRSLSLLDDFGGRSVGTSLQSLPPRPLAPPLLTTQHSLSLNDSLLGGLPRPVPLRPRGQLPPPPPRCPLSRPDAGSFATSLRELEKCGWYWGPMNWEDAEMKLKGKADGSFLVRDSSDPRYILSLSFRSQGVTHHTRMEHYRGTFSLWCHPKFEDRCHSVVEFIERAIMHSKNGKFLYFLRSRVPGLPPTPVQLLHPVSRFSSVKSLQHLCRFCIRQLVRVDHVQELPLPRPLISYLRKFYYYDPEEEINTTQKERRAEPGAQAEQRGAGPVGEAEPGSQMVQLGAEPGGQAEQHGAGPGGQVDQQGAEPGGQVDQQGAEPGGQAEQHGAGPGGQAEQHGAGPGGETEQQGVEPGGQVDQQGAEPGGQVDQQGAEPGGQVDQQGAEPGGLLEQQGAEPGGQVEQQRAEPGGQVDQQGAEPAVQVQQQPLT